MARVHLLDDELINKIAAGEVVERPASVVKELVENAIDAGATQIRVSLKDGGRQLIQVTDDGFGMAPDDAILSIKRHTTSKLARAEDLFSVHTMGFRGEALASISSVSRFTLQTQARDQDIGVRLTWDDSQLQSVDWSGASGTTVTVADLFYNVPARKSFMKTGAAEFAACHEYMQALALSLPQIGFTLLHNDREVFHVLPVPLAEGEWRGEKALRRRVEDLFGEDLAQPLLYVAKADRYARIEGLVSAPGQDKANAKFVFSFVNQRWVRDKLLRYGILRGYHSHLLKGKFPIAFLHVDVDAALVDVNVHPAKAELRFQYGSEVQNAIATALREGLRKGAWAEAPSSMAEAPILPPPDFDLQMGAVREPSLQASSAVSRPSALPRTSVSPARIRETVMSFGTAASMQSSPRVEVTSLPAQAEGRVPAAAEERSKLSQETIPWDELQYLGAFARCYLLFEYQQQLLVIDQHAFHERVLYERLQQNPSFLKSSQPLLMPEVLAFRPSEILLLEQKQQHYASLGLRYQILNETEVEVQAVPSLLMKRELETVIQALLDGVENSKELLHDHLATIACHAAVRAGEELPEPELRSLLQEAKTVDFYHNCPHGRRVFRWWKMSQVAAWFDRLG